MRVNYEALRELQEGRNDLTSRRDTYTPVNSLSQLEAAVGINVLVNSVHSVGAAMLYLGKEKGEYIFQDRKGMRIIGNHPQFANGVVIANGNNFRTEYPKEASN